MARERDRPLAPPLPDTVRERPDNEPVDGCCELERCLVSALANVCDGEVEVERETALVADVELADGGAALYND